MNEGSRAAGLATRLVRRLTGLDVVFRQNTARRILESISPEISVEILETLLARRRGGDRGAATALDAIISALSEMGELDTASDIYAEAVASGQDEVRRLLMRPAPARSFDSTREQGIDHEMRSQTVGMRRQMAKTADPVVMSRLQTDPNPRVISDLLRHPKLTEPEVVRMAARRPCRPEVLIEIYRSRRWSTRLMVRKALANNPYTPTEIALKLVPLLPEPAVRELAADAKLHLEVRRSARVRLVETHRRRTSARAAANLDDVEPEGEA